MIVQIVLAMVLVGDGRTVELTDGMGACDYGFSESRLRNSANMTLGTTCWRLNASNGHIEFDSADSRLVEEFDWTPEGRAWLRKITRSYTGG